MSAPRLPGDWAHSAYRDPTPELPEALCREVLWPDAWHPQGRGVNDHVYAAARRVCHTCPELLPCATYAIPRPDLTGLWGGLTEQDRTDIRAGRKAPPWG